MERRKRSANQEPVIVLDEEEKMEPIHKLLKLDRDKVKTIQSEMRTKGLVLSQTWSDLYSLMSRYQAELITREDQLIDIESQLDAQRNIARDNELERMKLQMQAKDREIKTIHMDMLNKSELLVKTQNELGRVKCLLRSKDDLIRKLQCEVKVEEDSVMAGDSPAEQVSTKTATSATSSSGTGTDTSSLIIEQTHLEEHVQTNFSRSGSDDSGTGAEKTDAKYQVSSSNDEETDSFLPLESDVATINIPGQDSGVLEEVQPGTSATDDTGQGVINEFSSTLQQFPHRYTSFSKLTNALMSAMFDRKTMARSTLTGRGGRSGEKIQLQPEKVQHIIGFVERHYPRIPEVAVRQVMGQKLKDEAIKYRAELAKAQAFMSRGGPGQQQVYTKQCQAMGGAGGDTNLYRIYHPSLLESSQAIFSPTTDHTTHSSGSGYFSVPEQSDHTAQALGDQDDGEDMKPQPYGQFNSTNP
ncbi:uncharacterized protein LOC135488022 isoform X3 [Lineus longissimus]|uniref:uncharacterized protein LOC135488022 isoform X3 n=1 Tax=Lineus longissimus TaxID=88925 RepID=UPI00315D742B